MNEGILPLLKCLKELNARLYVESGSLKLDIGKGLLTQELRDAIALHKSELIEFLGGKEEYTSIPAIAEAESYPISDAQRRLWVISQFEDGSIAYNMPGNIFLRKNLNLDNFKRAVQAVIEKHEILRTVFRVNADGDVRQWILSAEELNFSIKYIDFRNEKDAEECAQNYVIRDSFEPFDLENGPLIRASILQIVDEEFIFYYNMHHIISDGWSMDVLSKDVLAHYQAFEAGTEAHLPRLKIQYKDYTAWLLKEFESESNQHHKNYWLDNISKDVPALELPGNKLRPQLKTYNGENLITYISKSTTRQLKDFIDKNGGSLFMGLLACWKVLCHRYTGNTQITIGTPVAGRDHLDLQDQIGSYINTLALQSEINSEESFTLFYSRLKSKMILDFNHQMYPFDRLVEELDIRRDSSRSALFDVIMTLQNSEELDGSIENTDFDSILESGRTLSKFDLDLNFIEVSGCIKFSVNYNTDVYEDTMVRGLLIHFKQLISSLVLSPTQSIGSIQLLTETEQKSILEAQNTPVNYPKDKTIVDLFEAQCEKNKDRTAVVFEGNEFTYEEINNKSNQLANYLENNYSIQNDDLVGIKLDRSEKMIISILAILKAGGAYVPIDPIYPQSRIEYMLNDSNCKVLIDEEEWLIFESQEDKLSKLNLNKKIDSNNLAYVIYTSGTTGNPKGTLIEHRNVVRLFKTDVPLFDFTENDTWCMFHSYCFDFSVWEMYGALLFGGKLVVVPNLVAKDPVSFIQLLKTNKVTVLNQTPSSFYNLIREMKENNEVLGLRYVIFGGEALSPWKLKEWSHQNPDTRLINMYGITETTVHVTYKELGKEEFDSRVSNIGKAIPSLSCFVLDQNKQLLPFGVPGELYVGGDGVARGYLNREELTTERFITSPFNANDRLYRSGDKVRLLESGEMEYLGRIDNQVKIRGYRIELGEVEKALTTILEIETAVVLVKESADGTKELAAYFTTNTETNIGQIRENLKSKLPDYMVPSHFNLVDEIPLTNNGKVDAKTLLNSTGFKLLTGVEYVGPRNETEEKLVEIWSELFERENIGVKDNFFDLGGHSLKAVQLITKYHQTFEIKLGLRDLFMNVTIEDQSNLLMVSSKSSFERIEKIPEAESYAISDAQRRLWVLSQFEGGLEAYNMPEHMFLNDEIDIENFERAIVATIERHEILRTYFSTNDEGIPRQVVIPTDEVGFKITQLDYRLREDKEDAVNKYILDDMNTPFNIEASPLLRACLIQLEDAQYIFQYNMHHIISDGWSLEVLYKDVMAYYQAFVSNSKPELDELRIQYKDYSAWQLNMLKNGAYDIHRDYWLDNLSGTLPTLNLPSRKTRPKVQTFTGCNVKSYISKETKSLLDEYTKEQGGSLFISLLAFWNVLLHRYSGANDLIIGSPTAGRHHIDLEDQIGFFIDPIALRNYPRSELSFNSFYQSVKKNTLESLSHCMYPFDRLVEELNLPRDISRRPVFDATLALQNFKDHITVLDLTADEVDQMVFFEDAIAKFDLDVTFIEEGDYLSMIIDFNTDVYEKELIVNLITHFKELIKQLIENPEAPLGSISFLNEYEDQLLLNDFNTTEFQLPEDQFIINLFERQVEKTPDASALVFNEYCLSYTELNEITNQFANYLKDQYIIEPDSLIGIKLQRSEWMIVSMLAIFKLGAVYVPIDPEYPAERIKHLETDSNCVLTIDKACLESFQKVQKEYEKENLAVDLTAKSLAYVMYTSGSTGTAKGVQISHGSLVNYCEGFKAYFNLDQRDSVVQQSSISFDVSVEEIFPALTTGAKLVILENGGKDIEGLVKLVNDESATILSITPLIASELNNHSEKLGSLRVLISGGDKLEAAHVNNLIHTTSIYNTYGPTETTVCATYFKIDDLAHTSLIGTPISNAKVYILNDYNRLQGIGIKGEICIAGAGLSSGYLNEPELTDSKFVDNPFIAGEKMYKTGDVGLWLPNGVIQFLGRKDDQVKIRGYRVEPGEIESVQLEIGGVLNAVVIAVENEEGINQLISYLVLEDGKTTSEIHKELKERLPFYMVPSHFVQLEELPITRNGKVDKDALPNPSGVSLSSGAEYIEPRNEIEERLCTIWKQLLRREKVGIKDDFFLIGGDSIKLIQLKQQMNLEFKIIVDMVELFNNSTIEVASEYVKSMIQLDPERAADTTSEEVLNVMKF